MPGREWVCPLCQQVFSSPQYVGGHIRRHHRDYRKKPPKPLVQPPQPLVMPVGNQGMTREPVAPSGDVGVPQTATPVRSPSGSGSVPPSPVSAPTSQEVTLQRKGIAGMVSTETVPPHNLQGLPPGLTSFEVELSTTMSSVEVTAAMLMLYDYAKIKGYEGSFSECVQQSMIGWFEDRGVRVIVTEVTVKKDGAN